MSTRMKRDAMGAVCARWWLVAWVVMLVVGLLGVLTPAGRSQGKKAAKPKTAVIENSIGMLLVHVPPGKFMMGSPDDEGERSNQEKQHEVLITKDIYIGMYEVTQGEYEKVRSTNPSSFSAKGEKAEEIGKQDTSIFPVECVSWQEAAEFCVDLSKMPKEMENKRRYRLPTEAEWEYACRGGPKAPTAQPFHFGLILLSEQANFNAKDKPYGNAPPGDKPHSTCKVGRYEPNLLSLYDMHGNVAEWCSDVYREPTYKNRGKTGTRDPQGPTDLGGTRVVRGGSWESRGGLCRSAERGNAAAKMKVNTIGFRVVVEIEPSKPLPQLPPNIIGMEFVAVEPPKGSTREFTFGSSEKEQLLAFNAYKQLTRHHIQEAKDHFEAEAERRESISYGFYMSIHEVTQAQYARVMRKNPSFFSGTSGGQHRVQGLNTNQFPVERVSWDDAVAFCEKLSELDQDLMYRLPSEKEWEYACRGGRDRPNTATAFHLGNSLSAGQANFYSRSPFGEGAKSGTPLGRPCEVGTFEKNALGLRDMHGNVWEWCKDPYENSTDPTKTRRVIRGGSWLSEGVYCRSAFRRGFRGDLRVHDIGFRVVAVPVKKD